jgi:hypothetical protein
MTDGDNKPAIDPSGDAAEVGEPAVALQSISGDIPGGGLGGGKAAEAGRQGTSGLKPVNSPPETAEGKALDAANESAGLSAEEAAEPAHPTSS